VCSHSLLLISLHIDIFDDEKNGIPPHDLYFTPDNMTERLADLTTSAFTADIFPIYSGRVTGENTVCLLPGDGETSKSPSSSSPFAPFVA